MSEMRAIARAVAARHRMTLDEMMSASRVRRLARARQEAMYLMVKAERWSLPRIGMFFGKDHTTILHGARAHERRLEEAKAADRASWTGLAA